MLELSYRDFSLDFHEKMGQKSIPIFGQMELTFRCNLKCVHCYITQSEDDKELTFQEIKEIIDQIHKAGCLWLSFTGGEPFVRDDFLDIYQYVKRKGFLISILTNATLLTPKIVDFLAKEPPFSIEISLYGITEETYERISQVKGSFDMAMKGIELIAERDLPFKIKTTALNLNFQELDRIQQYTEKLGVEFQLGDILFPKLDGSQKPFEYRLSTEVVIDLERFYPSSEDCQPYTELESPPPDHLFRCAAGISSFHISPYGKLIFCTYMRQPHFDLRKGSFVQGFYSLYPEIRSVRYGTNSKCRDCKIYYFCHKCPGQIDPEKSDREQPIEYFCELAHKRAKIQRESKK